MSENKRPRIKKEQHEIIIDEAAYVENACTKNAKKISNISENIITEFWIDKHYSIRDQHGDDFGKREGINIEMIEDVIRKSFKILKFFNFKNEKFRFVNFPPKKIRPLRLVLKQVFGIDETLNIIVEYNFIELNLYEVTVVTALRKENFTLSDGQYGIVFDLDKIKLMFKVRGFETLIDEYLH
ncbi:hypothetical protein C8C83_1698 [Flavobacterium sp. 90]|uniref:hypothetical protein n=1 Tax=unclassified Flavobacterium TaxID=196869 RepID=UPI000EB18DFB|nr:MULTISPECIES: hypothetical protein [unclassified Flavobacterium]RKR10032.1 hypothetical protein C8C82_2000 [Flavobacterium sp. 81]TCK53817.1 hypothetical protein C8C83_1698 [Flavobacterium sp. 90]